MSLGSCLWLATLILGSPSAPEDACSSRPLPVNEVVVSGDPVLVALWKSWWHRQLPILFPEPDRPELPAGERRLDRLLDDPRGGPAATALARLGIPPERRSLPELLATLRARGSQGGAIVLAMGTLQAGLEGHLEALLEDRVTGRHMAGDVRRPVPLELRAAAALGLGISGEPCAYQALRVALIDPDLPDELAAAVLVGLSFSGSPSDACRFEDIVRGGAAHGPLAREAAAASLGRHVLRDGDAGPLLARFLRSGDEPAVTRGAAVALWYDGFEEPDTVAALRHAAWAAADAPTRMLALLSLAGRADREVPAIARRALERDGPRSGYPVLALGLFGRAVPDARDLGLATAREVERADPEAAAAARQLLLGPPGPARPGRERSVDRISGGNALFFGAEELGLILDQTATLAR